MNQVTDDIRNLVEQQVFHTPSGKTYKSVLFTPDAILLCSKKLDSVETFKATFEEADGKTLTMTSTATLPYAELTGFRHQSGSDTMKVDSKGLKITWPGEFELENGETDIYNIFLYLEKVQRYRRTEIQLSSFKAILPNLGYVAICLGLTALLYNMAAGNMGTGSGHGRARAKAEFFKVIADTLGPIGCLLVGLAATGIASWFLWQKYNNPPVETRLEG
jgi:hypothetical protein